MKLSDILILIFAIIVLSLTLYISTIVVNGEVHKEQNIVFNKIFQNIESSSINCKFPAWKENGTWHCEYGWTAEYTPMAYWLNYEQNPTQENLNKAIEITSFYADNYDKMWDSMNHGFYGMPFVMAYKNTHDTKWRKLGLMSADKVVSHYNTSLGVIPHWNGTDQTIVDSMPNMIILIWAHNETGNPVYLNIANNHTNSIIDNMFKNRRESGALWHARDWTTGKTYNIQADNDNSSWGRGQAWFLYGTQAMYDYTKNPKYFNAFNDVAEFYIENSKDGIIENSISSSTHIKDTSGTAIANVAFIRMSKLGYPRLSILANHSISKLTSPYYLTKEGQLLHGCYNSKISTQPDVELIFGDYYLLEAIHESNYHHLTQEELHALQHHHGGWGPFSNKASLSELAIKLHAADMLATSRETKDNRGE